MAKSVGLSLSVSKLIIFIVVMVYITTYLAGLLRLKKENDTILNHHLPQVTNKVGLHSYSKKLTTNYFIKKQTVDLNWTCLLFKSLDVELERGREILILSWTKWFGDDQMVGDSMQGVHFNRTHDDGTFSRCKNPAAQR